MYCIKYRFSFKQTLQLWNANTRHKNKVYFLNDPSQQSPSGFKNGAWVIIIASTRDLIKSSIHHQRGLGTKVAARNIFSWTSRPVRVIFSTEGLFTKYVNILRYQEIWLAKTLGSTSYPDSFSFQIIDSSIVKASGKCCPCGLNSNGKRRRDRVPLGYNTSVRTKRKAPTALSVRVCVAHRFDIIFCVGEKRWFPPFITLPPTIVSEVLSPFVALCEFERAMHVTTLFNNKEIHWVFTEWEGIV